MAVRLLVPGGSERCVVSAAGLVALKKEQIPIESYFAVSGSILNVIADVLGLEKDLEEVWKNINVKEELQNVDYIDLALENIISFIDSRRYTRWIMWKLPWLKTVLPAKKEAKSIFRNKFINMLIEKYITPENYEKLKKAPLIEFPVLNIIDGKVEFISNHQNLSYELFKKFVRAAVSIPMLYPAEEINGKIYVDGGFLKNLFLGPALYRCQTGDILFILHTFPKTPVKLDHYTTQWLFVGWRSTELRHVINPEGNLEKLDEWLVFCKKIEKIFNFMLPWRWFFRKPRNKLFRFTERATLARIGRRLKFIKFPLVKKVEIYPDYNLNIFKSASPSKKDLSEAFDDCEEKTRKVTKEEISPHIEPQTLQTKF